MRDTPKFSFLFVFYIKNDINPEQRTAQNYLVSAKEMAWIKGDE